VGGGHGTPDSAIRAAKFGVTSISNKRPQEKRSTAAISTREPPTRASKLAAIRLAASRSPSIALTPSRFISDSNSFDGIASAHVRASSIRPEAAADFTLIKIPVRPATSNGTRNAVSVASE